MQFGLFAVIFFQLNKSQIDNANTCQSYPFLGCQNRIIQIKLDGHQDYVRSVCFSPDGNTLASGSGDKSIYLWEVQTGKQKSKLDGHSGTVRSVCFSPDGNTLASSSDEKSIYLWEVQTGKQIHFTDKSQKDILTQFKTPLFENNPLLESISTYITIVLISQTPIFQAQGTLVLQGEFINYQGVDLRSLLKSKGSYILENQVELQQK